MKHIGNFMKPGLLGILDGMNGPLPTPLGIDYARGKRFCFRQGRT